MFLRRSLGVFFFCFFVHPSYVRAAVQISFWLPASIFDFGVSARCIIPGSPDSCVRASHWISKCTWRTVSEMLTWKSSVVHITSVNEKALRD